MAQWKKILNTGNLATEIAALVPSTVKGTTGTTHSAGNHYHNQMFCSEITGEDTVTSGNWYALGNKEARLTTVYGSEGAYNIEVEDVPSAAILIGPADGCKIIRRMITIAHADTNATSYTVRTDNWGDITTADTSDYVSQGNASSAFTGTGPKIFYANSDLSSSPITIDEDEFFTAHLKAVTSTVGPRVAWKIQVFWTYSDSTQIGTNP